jgi:hypothetical protein
LACAGHDLLEGRFSATRAGVRIDGVKGDAAHVNLRLVRADCPYRRSVNPLTLIDPTGFDDIDGAGFVNGNDFMDFDAGPAPTLPPIAGAPDTYTGSNIPGVAPIGEASCSGNCAGFYASYDPVSFLQSVTQVSNSRGGVAAQIPYPGSEQLTTVNANGSTSTFDSDEGIGQGGLNVTAPGYHWVWTEGFDFAGLGFAIRPYNPAVAFAQTIGIGVGGSAGLYFRGAGTLIGAVSGGTGGFIARGWSGVAPGALAGAALGGASSALLEGTIGIAGAAGIVGSGVVSGGGGAFVVNVATGNSPLQGVPLAAAMGGLAPLITGEAMIAGGAGIGATAFGAASAAVGTALGGLDPDAQNGFISN